jgi:hypothetical protein
MAVVALLAVTTLMIIFAAVAVNATILKSILEVLLTVTVVALQPGMRIFERKVCFRMIKPNSAP